MFCYNFSSCLFTSTFYQIIFKFNIYTLKFNRYTSIGGRKHFVWQFPLMPSLKSLIIIGHLSLLFILYNPIFPLFLLRENVMTILSNFFLYCQRIFQDTQRRVIHAFSLDVSKLAVQKKSQLWQPIFKTTWHIFIIQCLFNKKKYENICIHKVGLGIVYIYIYLV